MLIIHICVFGHPLSLFLHIYIYIYMHIYEKVKVVIKLLQMQSGA